MANVTHAVFANGRQLREALGLLAQGGVGPEDIEVRSSIPLDEESLGPAGQRLRSRVPLMAVLGGAIGGIAAYLLVALTSRAYPLVTGGMPIVPLMSTAIIVFEGAAMGCILLTVATVLFECRLPRLTWRPGPFDAELAAGKIVVAVRGKPSPDWTTGALATSPGAGLPSPGASVPSPGEGGERTPNERD
jgi:hypothetical protein